MVLLSTHDAPLPQRYVKSSQTSLQPACRSHDIPASPTHVTGNTYKLRAAGATSSRFNYKRGRGVAVGRILTSARGKPGSIPGGVAPVFSVIFLGDIPFPPTFHSDVAPYSPRFTLIGSHDLCVKEPLKSDPPPTSSNFKCGIAFSIHLIQHSRARCGGRAKRLETAERESAAATAEELATSPHVAAHGVAKRTANCRPPVCDLPAAISPSLARAAATSVSICSAAHFISTHPRVFRGLSWQQARLDSPLYTRDIIVCCDQVRPLYRTCKHSLLLPAYYWSSVKQGVSKELSSNRNIGEKKKVRIICGVSERGRLGVAQPVHRLQRVYSSHWRYVQHAQSRAGCATPGATITRYKFNYKRGRGVAVGRLLTSDRGKPGSIPGGVVPVFSVSFLGDIPFPPTFHSDVAPYSPRFTLIGSHDLCRGLEPMRVNEVSIELRRNERAVQNGRIPSRTGFNSLPGHPRMFVCGYRAGRCSWSLESHIKTARCSVYKMGARLLGKRIRQRWSESNGQHVCERFSAQHSKYRTYEAVYGFTTLLGSNGLRKPNYLEHKAPDP
ncbi:hypothetical protein PR048_001932 [Dryococelus australis]|uniref:Ribosomal protein L2 n=1 Tax=Dryococelus australis TaxID=614101 RepID=A0ABQ9IL87_9NEOP|nr:hypothetical protein PR048_001932 [Dryococelus australis]